MQPPSVQIRLPILQILLGVFAMSMLGWAVHIEHPYVATVVWACATIVAVIAVVQKPEANSSAGLVRRSRRLIELAKTTTPVKFYNEHYTELNAVRILLSKDHGVEPRYDMQTWLTNAPRTEQDMKNIVTCLEWMLKHWKSL